MKKVTIALFAIALAFPAAAQKPMSGMEYLVHEVATTKALAAQLLDENARLRAELEAVRKAAPKAEKK